MFSCSFIQWWNKPNQMGVPSQFSLSLVQRPKVFSPIRTEQWYLFYSHIRWYAYKTDGLNYYTGSICFINQTKIGHRDPKYVYNYFCVVNFTSQICSHVIWMLLALLSQCAWSPMATGWFPSWMISNGNHWCFVLVVYSGKLLKMQSSFR